MNYDSDLHIAQLVGVGLFLILLGAWRLARRWFQRRQEEKRIRAAIERWFERRR